MRDHDDYRARKIAEFREKTRVCVKKKEKKFSGTNYNYFLNISATTRTCKLSIIR